MSRRSIEIRKLPAALLAALLCFYPQLATAQVYDSFRLVGNHPATASGFVTSITFNADTDSVTVDYLNVAGVSSVFEAALTPAVSIPATTPVFMPPAEFLDTLPPSLDLDQIDFYNGRFVSADGTEPPGHWFRLTRFNDRFSGVFRIDNRLYAINRYSADPTVLVHAAQPNTNRFLPNRRVKVSAIIDEEYLQADTLDDGLGMDNIGHLFALESINVMDGLLTDSMGISVLLEQLIYQPSSALAVNAQPHDLITGAQNWYRSNADAFGLTDNLATLYFRGTVSGTNTSPDSHPQTAQTSDNIVVQGNSASYQFATAHYFGAVLGIISEPGTLQDWQFSGAQALPNVHWSERQRSLLELNPPPAEYTQTISNDEPQVASPPDETVNEVDSQLVIAESPETSNPSGNGLISDDFGNETTLADTTTSGGGSVDWLFLWLLLIPGLRIFHNR